ncbi:MAG TPA: hypothetical protein VHK69_06870 [Chitinophagaceae bacterium]|nr:hypothetical protein [Chitinophagaceae bacterium]
MRYLLLFVFTLMTLQLYAQRMVIITPEKARVEVAVLDEAARSAHVQQFSGRQENSLRKKWTARTYVLSNGNVLVEFYDRSAVLLNDTGDFRKLNRIRFVKNRVDFLKKNVSYKIEMSYTEGKGILQREKPIRLEKLKSDLPGHHDFEVYQLSTGQVLFLEQYPNLKSAAIYPDLKTLSSDVLSIQQLVYGNEDDEHLMKRLAAGDPLLDYEPNEQLLYPKYEKDLIKNHRLRLIEQKVYLFLESFYGNLYRSENGYYLWLTDFNQLNIGKTRKLGIGRVRIYERLEEVRADQQKYEAFKNGGGTSEHFYTNLSDRYGKDFPRFVPQLVDSLPFLLNFDKEQLSFDSAGMDLVDEALKWNSTDYELFNNWFPAVLAYYGQCYMQDRQDGKWTMLWEKEDQVWIPELRLKDGRAAWDWLNFYKSLSEGPVPIRWAGDWDGYTKRIQSGLQVDNSD